MIDPRNWFTVAKDTVEKAIGGMDLSVERTGSRRKGELGATGLTHYSGHVYDEFLPELKEHRQIKVYEQMSRNDAVVGAMLFAIEMLVRSVDWDVQPVDDMPESEESAQFVRECLHDMSHSWEMLLSDILSFLVFGWSYHEIVYKKRNGVKRDRDQSSAFTDGKIGWAKLPIRSQNSLDEWEISDAGTIAGMWQRAAPKYQRVFIPIEKALLFRTESNKNSPEGRSILRTAYRSWYYKSKIQEIEAIGIERDLAGIPYARIPVEVLQDQDGNHKATVDAIKKMLTEIRQDENAGILYPSEIDGNGNEKYHFELLRSSGGRNINTTEVVERYDKDIARTVLADFLKLGDASVGSYALSHDKTSLFITALSAWMDTITDVFNRQAIPELFKVNGMPDQELPRLMYDDINTEDIGQLAEYISKLAQAGMPIFPDEEVEAHLKSKADLPVAAHEDEDM